MTAKTYTVTFSHYGKLYRDICEWSERTYAQDKARQLSKMFGNVRVVPAVGAAAELPIFTG